MVYNNIKSDGMADISSGNHGVSEIIGSPSKESDHVWEHAWTTDEIRKNSSNWTLAGDVGLLNHLKQFSHKLMSKTHELENMIESLLHTSKVTYAKVNNVVNDFQMLSNLQFVENRVYDEEAKSPEPEPIPDEPKSKEQREAEMMPRVIKAVNLGISVLDTAFEKIEMDETSESEDEEDMSQGRTMLEPKDLYEHRPLPYIIGSEAFQRDDYAGLHNLYEEDISTDISAQDENVSASAESEDETEDEESDFEEDFHKRSTLISDHKDTKTSIGTLHNKYSESEGSDLFDAEEEGEKDAISNGPEPVVEEKPMVNTQSSFMEELIRKTRPPNSSSNNDKPETIQSSVPTKVEEKKDSDDLFASTDSFFDDEDSPFRKKTGLFTSDGLFGKESKSEGSLFDDDEAVPVKKDSQPKTVEKQSTPLKKEPLINKRPKSPTLFDDDDDSEQDLFSSVPSVPAVTKTSSQTSIPNKKKDHKASPIQSDKVVQNNQLFSQPEKKSSSNLFSEEENDDDFTTTSAHSNKPLIVPESKVETNSLFDEEPDDFYTPPVQLEKKLPQENKPFTLGEKKANSSSLFSEDSDDNDLFSATPKSNQKNLDFGKFDDGNDEDDDLFSTKSSMKNKQESKFLGSEKKVETEKTSYPSLFEESGSFDLFKPKVEEAEKTSVHQEEKTKPPAKVTETIAKTKQSASLFEESDSFDLFSPAEKATKKSEINVPKKLQPEVKVDSAEKYKETVSKNVNMGKSEAVSTSLLSSTDGDISLSFDEPVTSSNTLSAINKDRVKIQTKRRKPTRKGRQSHVSADVENDLDDRGPSELPPVHIQKNVSQSQGVEKMYGAPEKPQEQLSKPQSTFSKTEQSKKNLMSMLISEAASSKIGKKPVLDAESEDDLFGEKKASSKTDSADFSLVSPSSSSEILVKDNLASSETKGGESSVLSGSTSDDDLFSAPAFNDFRSSVSDKNSLFDDDDDIFKPMKNKDGAKHSIEDLAVDDDDDDIFAGVEKEKYEMFPTQQYDDDDDDIFSSVKKPSQAKPSQEKKNTKKEPKKEDVDLFSDPLGGLSLND